MLNFIEKYKFAIIGTVLFHVGFFMYANFTTMQRPIHFAEETTPIEIPLEDIVFDPEMMKLLEIPPATTSQTGEVYNVSSDANDTRDKSYENFSTQEMDQMVQQNADALEQQYFNEWAATHGNDPGKEQDNSFDIQNEDDRKNPVNQTNSGVDASGDKAFAGDVMASFNLSGRKVHSLEKPGYTCNSSGTVVLDIKVDRNGDMQSATYNADLSVNATECMIKQSLKYANRSRFNYSSTAPAVQNGTITYKFVSK